MKKKIEDILIQIEEKYGDQCLSDSQGKSSGGVRRPQGRVEIYEIDNEGVKQLIRKSNLVVYDGRELITQKIFDLENTHVDTDKDEFLYWFGLGSGGVNPADPFDPVPPVNSDTDLYEEIPISATDTTCADFHDGAYYKHPFDSVVFEQDSDNDGKYLIAKVITTIDTDDANDEEVSEAGLFSNLSNAGGALVPFHLFARVTFPTILKTNVRRLTFVWYLYF